MKKIRVFGKMGKFIFFGIFGAHLAPPRGPREPPRGSNEAYCDPKRIQLLYTVWPAPLGPYAGHRPPNVGPA